jgi:ADP-heptose:LPS heptosyltransferase
LGGLGDVVFTLPAVEALACAFPEARITYLVYHEFAPLLEAFPGIDKVIHLDRSRYRGLDPRSILTEVSKMLSGLRRGRFDLAVDFQGFGETGLLSWWTRAPQRWGIVYRPARAWAYTRGIRRNSELHPIDCNLDLLRQAGGISSKPSRNELVLPAKATNEARRLFSEWKLDPAQATVLIQPFSKVDHKNWPLDNYLATARQLRHKGAQVFFGGGPSERAALEPARQAGFPVAAGTSVLVSAGLVSLSSAILGSDTGLLHVAVALGKRVVMLINSTTPGKCFPYGHPDWTVLPENRVDVFSVKPEHVLEACVEALAQNQDHAKPTFMFR